MFYRQHKFPVTSRHRQLLAQSLTTSSNAALRPKEQVRCVRQLTKEEKSSLGMAVKTFRGNTVIRLLIMLEIPTASESSISILQPNHEGYLAVQDKLYFQTQKYYHHSLVKACACINFK